MKINTDKEVLSALFDLPVKNEVKLFLPPPDRVDSGHER